MTYKLIVDPSVKIDITESIDWYNQQQPKLGFRFYKAVKITISLIHKNPFNFAIRYKTNRTAMVEKFPYLIHFTVFDKINTIVVFAVLHTSRNPEIWDKRS